ncbi:MAG: DUF4350 domain-containing protein, partial [Elusimicrobia bacterium]|nr:DUF4350 domain-containing protein [Elusimicrobiota bacterium]
MTRRAISIGLAAAYLFWLLWPRPWMPRREPRAPSALAGARVPDAAPDRAASQAAVLLLAPDETPFAAERVLRAAGVPFTRTSSLDAALAHRLVLVPLGEKAPRMSREERLRLRAFVEDGGTLVVQTAGLLPWPEITGLDSAAPSRRRGRIVFRPQADLALRALPPGGEELTLTARGTARGIWTAGLTP